MVYLMQGARQVTARFCCPQGAMYVDGSFSAVRRVQHPRWPVPADLAQLLGPSTPLVL